MNYQLKDKSNGEIDFIATAGSDFVKSSMPIGRAKGIIASGKVKVSDKFADFEICVNDGEYFFAGTVESEVKEEKPDDEPKTEDKPFIEKEDYHFKKGKWRK